MAEERRVFPIPSHNERNKPRESAKAAENRREAGQERDETTALIEGRNAVMEALESGKPVDKIYLAKGNTAVSMDRLISAAKVRGIAIVECDRRKLDSISETHAHQGVIAVAAVRDYDSVEDILARAQEKGEPPLLVICDGLSDPHNLGAVIRSAECAGAHGVVVPKRRSAGLTATVDKTSAGAVNYLPVARVVNLTELIKQLKKQGIWIFGTAADGDTPLYQADLRGPAAIVIGSEGKGMSRLVSENCDFRLAIPQRGKVSSLNASVAAAVVLFEAVRQRMEI